MTEPDDTLDPWVVQWMADNPLRSGVFDTLDPAIVSLARGDNPFPVTREIARVTDDEVEGIPIRIYEHEAPATGLLVYLHGGGFCIGSIGLMDNVARELAHATGAAVVSVEYRLAAEHPYPAGLDDCEVVTRWALANADRFGVAPTQVAVTGESAGGNLSAAVALRLRDAVDPPAAPLAAQVLLYPGTAGRADDADLPSRRYFDGIVLSDKAGTCSGARTAPGATSTTTRTPHHCGPTTSPACRRRSWCSGVATCCATRAGRTRTGSATPASTPRRSATRASPTAS